MTFRILKCAKQLPTFQIANLSPRTVVVSKERYRMFGGLARVHLDSRVEQEKGFQ